MTTAMVASLFAACAEMPKDTIRPPHAGPAGGQPRQVSLSAADKLKACAERYSTASTYRDESELKIEVEQTGGSTSSCTIPSSMAFERDGRFRWQCKGLASADAPPDLVCTVWSTDHRAFNSFCSAGEQRSEFETINRAMDRWIGLSGGSAAIVLPLLLKDVDFQWGPRITDLLGPIETGTEMINGVDCSRIEGKTIGDTAVTLWLDSNLAIRKVHCVQLFDRAKMPNLELGAALTQRSTIVITPVLNEAIEEAALIPPASK